MKKGVKTFLLVLVLVVLLAIGYFMFFFSYKCGDLGCFQAHQVKCSKARFLNDADDATWFYKIKGKESGKCKIYVEMKQVKTGTLEKGRLKGKSMNCFVPLKSIVSPESDLLECHGELKEELQRIIINKLHSYIVDNLGEISGELNKAI